MRYRIEETDLFRESRSRLEDSPETSLVVDCLIEVALDRPELGPEIPGYHARVLRSGPYRKYPPLRLIYRLVGNVVYLFEIQHYDPLDGPDRGSA